MLNSDGEITRNFVLERPLSSFSRPAKNYTKTIPSRKLITSNLVRDLEHPMTIQDHNVQRL